jgi:hypothetical protein
MSLTINKSKKPKHVSCFVISVEYMFGDADGGKTVETSFKDVDKDRAEEFYKFMKDVIDEQNRNWNNYAKLQEYAEKQLLANANLLAHIEKNGLLSVCGIGELLDWPSDPMTDYQTHAIPRSISISYYNNGGVEHSVTVK